MKTGGVCCVRAPPTPPPVRTLICSHTVRFFLFKNFQGAEVKITLACSVQQAYGNACVIMCL